MEEQKKEEKLIQSKTGITLPTKVSQDAIKNLRNLVLYGKPKSGKTTALSQLKNCLIIDLEKGSAFINGCFIMQPPEELGPVGRFKWLRDVAKEIKIQGRPYDFVAIDTLSQLDIDSEWVGTYNYMNSVSGKKFNRLKDDDDNLVLDAKGKTTMLKSTSPQYESVLTLGQGYGYKYTREAIMDLYEDIKDLGKICTIFVCHVADKMIGEKNGELVMSKDLALTGKVRDLIPRISDGIANIWNEDGNIMISFNGNADKIGGVRAKHLQGFSGILDWSKIFI